MKRFLFVLALLATIPAFADDVCPAGYEPAKYVELEYIQSTGTQYIDTGIMATSDIDILAKLQVLANGTQYIAGIDGDNNTYRISQSSTGNGLMGIVGSSRISTNVAGVNTGIHTMTIKNSVCGIDGVEYGRSEKSFQSGKSILMFAVSKASTSKIRLYNFEIWANNILVRDFIPVRRLSDGVIGMHDRVSGNFYKNSGTGEFIAGPEVQSSTTDENGNVICVSCPANTYKSNAGNEACTPCLEHTFSPTGSTALSDCAKILHVGNYVVFMPVGRRTEHGLCTMFNGEKYCADVYKKQ